MLPISLTFWAFIETILKKHKDKLIKGNYSTTDLYKFNSHFLAGIHAVMTIFSGTLYLITKELNLFYFLFFFSIIYFIYDSYSIWFNRIKEYYLYLLHHGASIYFLQCLINYEGITKNLMVFGYILIEISNLAEYYIYYFLKTAKTKDNDYYKKLLNLKMGQLIVYVLMRVFGFGYLMKITYKEIIHKPVLSGCFVSLYIMGLYWSYKLTQSYLKTKKEYEELIERTGDLNNKIIK